MPNHARTQIDAVWVGGYVVPTADWEDLERKLFESINGDRGGAYCPGASAGWSIGGSGLKVSGPTKLLYGGSVDLGASAIYRVRDGAWPLIASTHVGKRRVIAQTTRAFLSPVPHLWSVYHPYGGIGSVALACRESMSRTVEQAEFYCPLEVHDGATLLNVRVNYRIAQPRKFAPIATPKVRILRVPKQYTSGARAEPLKKTTDGTGFASPPTVASGALWYADGLAKTFDYVCDQNALIDVSAYHYVAHIIDEQGASTPEDEFDGIRYVERKLSVDAADTNTVVLNGATNVDGVATSSSPGSNRVMLFDSDATLATGFADSSSTKNGIYTYNAAAWPRASDIDSQNDFSPFWIVLVRLGGLNSGTVWQCEHPSSAQPITLATTAGADASRIRIRPAEPRGNYYHSLEVTCDLQDLRFQ